MKKKIKYHRYTDDLDVDFSSYEQMTSKFGRQPDGGYALATEYSSNLMAEEWVNCIDRAIKAREALKPKRFKFKKRKNL